jgi:cardiolipin synthase
MIDAGVDARKFVSTTNKIGKLQINFRNHRKIVVVEGKIGFTGGINVGDEYLGKSRIPNLTPWRDTFARVEGPVVQFLQVPFAEDWFWTTKKLLTNLSWEPGPAMSGNMNALALPTGPADPFDTCALFFASGINSAKRRIWIASPYFVPDGQIVSALQLAALRGVDVRILIPQHPDSRMVYYSGFTYLPEVEKAGVKIYRYQTGFLHQKCMLVDDDFASVGTANLDNRSFRLNFEVILAVMDREFARNVEAMFVKDFERSKRASAAEMEDASFFFRLTARVCRLLAPIQ